MVQLEDFAYREEPVPEIDPAKGEVLVRNLYLSFDPAMRGWMDDVPSYMPPVPLNAPMRCGSVAQVVRSSDSNYPQGILVQGMFGWQDYAITSAQELPPPQPVPAQLPPQLALGILGGSGLTAYFGLLEVGRPRAGETVVVSGAAGAVGSMAAQIARIKGCRVIGIAGSEEKCAWLRDTLKLDGALNYRRENLQQRLGELCPEGINVFFDNVGGETLQAALAHIAEHGRVVLCGQISRYNDAQPRPGPNNLMQLIVRSASIEGFLLLDYLDRLAEGGQQILHWLQEGSIQYREDIRHGMENVPATFLDLFTGHHEGKLLLKLADPSPG